MDNDTENTDVRDLATDFIMYKIGKYFFNCLIYNRTLHNFRPIARTCQLVLIHTKKT